MSRILQVLLNHFGYQINMQDLSSGVKIGENFHKKCQKNIL